MKRLYDRSLTIAFRHHNAGKNPNQFQFSGDRRRDRGDRCSCNHPDRHSDLDDTRHCFDGGGVRSVLPGVDRASLTDRESLLSNLL